MPKESYVKVKSPGIKGSLLAFISPTSVEAIDPGPAGTVPMYDPDSDTGISYITPGSGTSNTDVESLRKRVEDTNEVEVDSDGSFTVNTDYASNVVLGGTDPVRCSLTGSGSGTLVYLTSDASQVNWPAGTKVHGRPPVGSPSFVSVLRINGEVHAVWSAVDVTEPVKGGGAGAVQMSLRSVLRGDVPLSPGGSVVSDGSDSTGLWQFTNMNPTPSTDLTLTNGLLNLYVRAESDGPNIVDIALSVGTNGYSKINAIVELSDGPTEIPDGSGVLIAKIPSDPQMGTDSYAAWGGLVQSFSPSCLEVSLEPFNPNSEKWLVLWINEYNKADGLTLSEFSVEFNMEIPTSPTSLTYSSEICLLFTEDLEEAGIKFPGTILSPEKMEELTTVVEVS